MRTKWTGLWVILMLGIIIAVSVASASRAEDDSFDPEVNFTIKPTAKATPAPTPKPTARVTPRPTRKATPQPTPKPTPKSVKLDKTGTVKLKIGKKLQLTAKVKPSGASQKITWKSSKPKVVKVSSKGKLTALKPGTSTITAKASNGKKATVKVTTYYSGKCGKNVTWKLDSKGVLTISGTGKMKDNWDNAYGLDDLSGKVKEIVIKKGVTSVGEHAFYYYDNVKKVTIPSTVKTIESDAFCNCSALKTVEIAKGVTTIQFGAFSFCDNLKSIKLPKSVKTIESWSFGACYNLESITIPSSVTSMGFGLNETEDDVFYNDDKVTIKGYKGSYAEKYANTYGIPFVAIG